MQYKYPTLIKIMNKILYGVVDTYKIPVSIICMYHSITYWILILLFLWIQYYNGNRRTTYIFNNFLSVLFCSSVCRQIEYKIYFFGHWLNKLFFIVLSGYITFFLNLYFFNKKVVIRFFPSIKEQYCNWFRYIYISNPKTNILV